MPGRFYAVKTAGGQEKAVAQLLQAKIQARGIKVYSILVIEKMKGYVLLEADNPAIVSQLIMDVKNVRQMVPGIIELQDIKSMISPAKQEITFNADQLVEVVNGPFKGMKAKVLRFDKEKHEAQIVLIDTPVQIQVTIDASYLKASQ